MSVVCIGCLSLDCPIVCLLICLFVCLFVQFVCLLCCFLLFQKPLTVEFKPLFCAEKTFSRQNLRWYNSLDQIWSIFRFLLLVLFSSFPTVIFPQPPTTRDQNTTRPHPIPSIFPPCASSIVCVGTPSSHLISRPRQSSSPGEYALC